MDASELTMRLLDDPRLSDALLGELDAGDYGSTARLRARWLLCDALAIAPGEIIRDATFQTAARELEKAGDPASARAMTELAKTGAEITTASREWSGRYSGRPQTASEWADAALLSSGRVTRQVPPQPATGVDGARYESATLSASSGRGATEIVLVTTSARTTEIVKPFGSARDRDEWVNDRLRGREGTIASWEIAQCRTTREEQVLAWALRQGDGVAATGGGWNPGKFTSHLRSEIFAAWAAASKASGGRPDLDAVEDALERRMLRAPWWGSLEVGGRDGVAATGYLHRLVQTGVSTPQAIRATQWLIREDREAAAQQRAAWRTEPGSPDRAARHAVRPDEQPAPALTAIRHRV